MKAFKHNCSERNSPQLKALISEAGIVSYGVYWYFLEELNEGNNIEMNNSVLKSLSSVFKIPVDELNVCIEVMIKLELFFKCKGRLINEKTLENTRKRTEAGLKGNEARWRGKDNSIIEDKGKVKTIIDKVFEVNPNKEQELPKEIQDLYKEGLIKKVADIPETPVKKTPVKKVIQNTSFKDWNFLALFNELKLEKKPRSKGHTALTATDRKNFNLLLKMGYGKDDFKKVIEIAFENKWVQDNQMDTPNHILRNDNFTRYHNQSDKAGSKNLIINESDEPVFK